MQMCYSWYVWARGSRGGIGERSVIRGLVFWGGLGFGFGFGMLVEDGGVIHCGLGWGEVGWSKFQD